MRQEPEASRQAGAVPGALGGVWLQRLAVRFACALVGNAVVVALVIAAVAAVGAALGEGPVLLRAASMVVAGLAGIAAWKARSWLVRRGLAAPLLRKR